MSIDTTIPVRKITYKGTELPLAEVAELEAEIKTLTEQKQILEAEKQDLQNQVDDIYGHYLDITQRYSDKVAEVEHLNIQLAEKQSQIDSLNARITELEAQLPIKYQEGHADGVSAEQFRFWDNLQYKGERDNYKYGFWVWYNPYNIFYPVYNIYGDCFEAFRGWGTGTPIDVAQRLKECGVTLNTKGTTVFSQFAAYAKVITRFPELDATDATIAQSAFYGCTRLVTIDKFKVSEKLTNYTNCFKNCPDLENIIFEGPIAADIDFSSCTKLSYDSHKSTMDSLSDTTSGKTATFSKVAVDKAFETSEGANDGSTSQKWTALVATKPNWSVVLFE